MIGQTLSHYRILEKIGVGGMGEVYLARDERLERDVAVKLLPQSELVDPSARKRLRKEAAALSKLNHPNIETLLDFESVEGLEFLVVEYVAGVTLSELLGRDPMPEKEIARLGMQLASGLAAAHAQKIVHRDLKPSNLRITPDGRLKILDFGIAKVLKPQHEITGMETTTDSGTGREAAVGTLPYMAPEQLQSDPADARTDIFAAGGVLYEMATGQRPFREEIASRLIDAILHQPVVPPRAFNGRISPELERIIVKCLEKGPENRYQSAQELEVDLRQLAVPRTTSPLPPPHQAHSRWKMGGVAGALAFVLAAGLLLLNAGGLRDRLLGMGGHAQIASLAVLPLENLSGNPDQDYFADGMTDQLITDLGQIKALRVISRISIMQYKAVKKPLPEVARALHVDAIVEGTVLRAGDQVRINAQLIYAPTDKQLWTKSYERDLIDVLKLQGDVASAIANEVRIAVTQQEREHLAGAPPVVPAAYEAYLRGRYEWYKGTEHDWLKARQYFEKAAQLDPNYAPAYAGLADYYWLTDELPPAIKMPKAKEYALKAVGIAPNLAEAHTALGEVRFMEDWNWPEAEREFKRALELDTGSLEAHLRYADYLSEMGRADEALAEAHRAQGLDPLSISTQVMIGWTFYYARRYDEAIKECQKVVDLEPNSVNAHDCLGLSYLAKKMYQNATGECQKAASLSGNDLNRTVGLARAYALARNQTQANDVLKEWQARAHGGYVPPSFFAQVYVALGQGKQGLAWLKKAYQERDPYLTRIKVDPAFDPIRSEPAFRDLIQRLGLPPSEFFEH